MLLGHLMHKSHATVRSDRRLPPDYVTPPRFSKANTPNNSGIYRQPSDNELIGTCHSTT